MKKMILVIIIVLATMVSVPVVCGADNINPNQTIVVDTSGTNAVVQKDEYCKPVELVMKAIGWVAVECIVLITNSTFEPSLPRGM